MQRFAVHFDQRYVGGFDTHADALDVINDHGNFERIATVPSASDTVEVYLCRGSHGVVNYAYASITITH
jgi:hypothetical protein